MTAIPRLERGSGAVRTAANDNEEMVNYLLTA